MLPEDGRSHEFDNVGDALGISMQHMQMYLKAAEVVLEEAIAQRIVGRYTDDKGAEKFVGDRSLFHCTLCAYWLPIRHDSFSAHAERRILSD